MKILSLLICFTCLCVGPAWLNAATVLQSPGLIEVNCFLDGSSGNPDFKGDTLDYLKFAVARTTTITVTSGFNNSYLLMLAAYIGRDDQFGSVDSPYRLEQTSTTEWSTLTRSLDPGVYIAVIGMLENTSYDIFDGFTAVNSEGGGFARGEYAYRIAGDVQALEYWDGELDGNFRILSIPEPSSIALLTAFSFYVLRLRNRSCQDGVI